MRLLPFRYRLVRLGRSPHAEGMCPVKPMCLRYTCLKACQPSQLRRYIASQGVASSSRYLRLLKLPNSGGMPPASCCC